jgi:DNA-binding CsgD family transcriptional regulator
VDTALGLAIPVGGMPGRSSGGLGTLDRLPPINCRRDVPIDSSEYGDIFLSIVENVGAGLAVVDPLLRIQENNPTFAEQCGHRDGELRGLSLCELLHPSVRQHVGRQFERLVERRNVSFVERQAALWATQPRFVGMMTGIAVHNAVGQVEAIVVLVYPDKADHGHRTLISPKKVLTEINARILEGVAVGIPTVQLASRLYLSRQGVEYHVSSMLRQFKVPNRAALVSKAYSMGMFKIGLWPPKVVTDYIRG